MSNEDSKEGRDLPAKPVLGRAASAPAPLPRARPAPRALQGPGSGKARPARQGGSQLARVASRTPAAQPDRSARAVSPQVERGEVTQLSGPTALQFTPAAWSTEALRIDHIAANRKRRRGFLLRMLVFVGLPTLLAAAYVYLYASPRYVSEFQITYQSIDPPTTSGSTGLLGSLLGASSGGVTVDMTRVLWSYLISDTLLEKIDKELDVRGHYSSPRIDWLDRLSPAASKEDFLTYFNRRVSIDDMFGGYVVVDVEAFDPKFAMAMAKAMAAACDKMVEDLSTRARQEEVRVAALELKKTQDRLIKTTLDVTNFRNAHVDFNPTAMATQLDTVVGDLETQMAQARAALISVRQTALGEKSPQIVSLKTRINGLEKQIDAEKLRLATTTDTGAAGHTAARDGVPYSKLVAEWTALELEQKFASDSYVSAKQAYDLARVDAERQENYVESFVKPNLPQRSTSPDPWTWIPATFLVSLVAYAIGSLLVGSFRDQAGL